MLERADKRFNRCIVAATGPSLSQEVAEACRGFPVIAVNDAFRRLPFANILYACDRRWWLHHKGAPGFKGERWSSEGLDGGNVKQDLASEYGLHLVGGRHAPGFSDDPTVIHYGASSGYQGINLALLMTSGPIILVGFDMHDRDGWHFFGDHPEHFSRKRIFATMIENLNEAARRLNGRRVIINATPGSALECFPKMGLSEALDHAERECA